MILRDRFEGGNVPFEGDFPVVLRSIPANAQIVQASAVVTPVQGTAPALFIEIIGFQNGINGVGDLGATKVIESTADPRWVEVDFHKRRTLARVRGTDLNNTTLQVDLGGAFVEINQNGAFKAPDDGDFTLAGDSATLPSLTVTKFKLTTGPSPTSTPDIAEVTIRSVPMNVSLRLGEQPPFWTHLGEMPQPETTLDFVPILQAFLDNAKAENGFSVVPLVVHSDTIARLDIMLEVEFVCQETALPEGVNEVVLPFDFGGLPQANADVLQVALPANARVVPRETTVRVIGTFDETRIVHGPTGTVTPVASTEVSPASSQAQLISLDTAVAATAIDVLIAAVTRAARLQLDLRDDLDGKPDGASLLPSPVELALDRDVVGEPTWVSVPLRTEFQFEEKTKRRYWLVMQSLEGEATWSVELAAPETLGMQHTQDGGLSWRDTTVSGATGTLAAFFRLRRQPERFQVPIELQVGTGDQARRVNLDRFQPLGRVDFALDFDEVAEAFNQHLAEVASVRCPQGEHLANGDFERWIVVGDNIMAPLDVPLNRRPSAMAVSPDGSLAYVGSEANSEANQESFLQLVDVTCDALVDEVRLNASTPLSAIVVHPDGSRIYVLTLGSLHIVDTSTHRELGVPLQLQGGGEALALTPDGRRMYVTEYFVRPNADTALPPQGAVQVFDIAKLEQVIHGQLTREQASITTVDFELLQQPTALAVAPDGSRLYVVIINDEDPTNLNQGEVHIIDTATHEDIDSIPVGRGPRGIALTPDGRQALVTNTMDNSVSIIDLASGAMVGSPISVGDSPIAVAIAPDGVRAFVANSGSDNVSVIDLSRRTNVETIDVGDRSVDVAITPQGDRVYVANADDESLTVIPVGVQVPAEWALTSGWVTPRCLPDPFHLAAALGPPSESLQPMPTALSQVVPVAASCPYAFSFWGLSTEPGAVAEVLWLGQDCGLLRTDQLPVQVLERPQVTPSTSDVFARRDVAQGPQLILRRMRLTAPEGATQAEVRFSVPAGSLAAIDMVSLMATAEAVVNGDLQLQQENLPANWTLSPTTTPGFSVIAGENGVALQNAGANTAALVQTVPVKANQPFALEFQGRAEVRPTAQSHPQIELHWFKTDGTLAGSPMTLEISPTDSSRVAVNGTVPVEAIQAEVRLSAPAGTTLEVERVSWQFSEPTLVPLTFVAQAPGELTVSDWRVAYELAETPPPQVPAEGLCSPTPPGQRPGECPADHCFCPCCETERPLRNTTPAVTAAGRPATVGTCRECGTQLVRQGGQLVLGAQRIAITRPAVRRRAMPRSESNGPLERRTKLAADLRTLLQDPLLQPLENLKLSEILELSISELYERIPK